MEQKRNVWTRLPVVILTAVFCCTLWGSASPAIKIGYKLFEVAADDTASRILFAGIRFTIAGVMVISAGSLLAHRFLKPKKSSAGCIAALAATQTVLQYIFFYMALAHISGVRGSILNAANTFFAIFLAVAVFHFEKLNAQKVIGAIIGFSGVVLIVSGGSLSALAGGFTLQGEGAMLLAAFVSALAGCLIKLFSAREDPVTLSGWQFFFGGLVMTAIGLAFGGRLVWSSAACLPLILYMGFISAGAYTLWGILLKYNPVSTVSTLGFVNPIMGVLLSALFLNESGEAFRASSVAALALVSLGIFIVNFHWEKRDEKTKISD